jgi:hypothetical protein
VPRERIQDCETVWKRLKQANTAESEFPQVGSSQRSAEGWHAVADDQRLRMVVDQESECPLERREEKPRELRQVLGKQQASNERQASHLPLHSRFHDSRQLRHAQRNIEESQTLQSLVCSRCSCERQHVHLNEHVLFALLDCSKGHAQTRVRWRLLAQERQDRLRVALQKAPQRRKARRGSQQRVNLRNEQGIFFGVEPQRVQSCVL